MQADSPGAGKCSEPERPRSGTGAATFVGGATESASGAQDAGNRRRCSGRQRQGELEGGAAVRGVDGEQVAAEVSGEALGEGELCPRRNAV